MGAANLERSLPMNAPILGEWMWTVCVDARGKRYRKEDSWQRHTLSQLCEMRLPSGCEKEAGEGETRETNELIHSAEGETGISVFPKVDLIQLEPSPERSPRCQRRRKVGKYDATRKRNFIYQSAFRINCWVSGDKEPRRHSQNPENYKGLKCLRGESSSIYAYSS